MSSISPDRNNKQSFMIDALGKFVLQGDATAVEVFSTEEDLKIILARGGTKQPVFNPKAQLATTQVEELVRTLSNQAPSGLVIRATKWRTGPLTPEILKAIGAAPEMIINSVGIPRPMQNQPNR